MMKPDPIAAQDRYLIASGLPPITASYPHPSSTHFGHTIPLGYISI